MECEGGVDRISDLPDDVILHVLSFVTLKNATATSALSTRWLDMWKYMPYLKFDSSILADEEIQLERKEAKYINWVNSVVKSHKALSLEEFSITYAIDESTQSEVTKWLEFAFSRRVKRLELDFNLPGGESPVIFDEILRKSIIQICDFKFLKELKLAFMRVGGEAIQLFLRNCPLLEQLSMPGTRLTSDIAIFGKSLKRVYLHLSWWRLYSIKISSTPNLTWLRIGHASRKVLLDNVPKLVGMDFICRQADTLHDFANAARHLETLILQLCYHRSKEFSVPKMPKLKKLRFYYRQVHKDVVLPITCLIEAAPCLQEFKFAIIELVNKKGIFELPKVGRFVHHHLKVFVFSGFYVEAPDHFELVKYVADNCVVLESMRLYTQFTRSKLNGGRITGRDDEERAFILDARRAIERWCEGNVPRRVKMGFGHLSVKANGRLVSDDIS